MSGFENLKTAVNESEALAPITPEQTAFEDEKLSDEKALGMVVLDAGIAERYLNSKALPASWNVTDDIFRAYVQPKTWPGSNEARAHLGMPLVLEVIESLLPQIHLAFFSDKTPFILSAQGTTDPGTARAAAKILKWAVKCSGFKEETRLAQKSCLQYGVGVGQWGWEEGEQDSKSYATGSHPREIVSETKRKRYSRPTFEWIDLRNLLVDPSLRRGDIRLAKFVIKQKFVTANDLDDMRADETYKNIPTREQLKQILAPATNEPAVDSASATKVESYREFQAEKQHLATSSDPLQQPLELLEYWSKDRVICVLQKKIVIRNDENEYDMLPFVSCPFVDVLNSFYGMGIGKLLEGEQKLEQGVVNAWLDSLSLTLSPAFHRKKGATGGSQNIKVGPGKVVNDDGELAPLEVQSVTAEALQAIQSSESRARRRVGANFGPDMPNQAMRTAEGVQEFTAGIQVRTQYFVDLFSELFFVPTLEAFIALAKDHMTPDDLDEVLTQEEGQKWEGNHINFYNGLYGIEVLSSTKLAAKRSMVSLVPTLMQLFSAAPVQQALVVQNKKLDLAEFLNQVIDLTGWDAPGLIVDMTPDDQQRALQLNPAFMKMQQELTLQQQQHQNDMELEDTKGTTRAGVQVVKHILDQSAPQQPTTPLALGNQG